MLMPISEYVSLPIKLQKAEQNWRNLFVSFYWTHYFLYTVWSLKYKIPFITENIHAFNYHNVCNFFRNTLFCGLLVRWLMVKNDFLWKLTLLLSSWVGNETNWSTTHNELFCVTLLQQSHIASIPFLITTLKILMAVRVYLNNLQPSDYLA